MHKLMITRRFALASLLVSAAGLAQSQAGQPSSSKHWRRVRWSDLLPPQWSPQSYYGSFDRAAVRDWEEDDPRAQAIIAKLLVLSRQAPTVPRLKGVHLEIAGFPVLYGARYGNTKLLLDECFFAPYQGACVHTPPPPGNQLIHVRFKQALPLLHAAYPMWVRGTLELRDTEHPMAVSRYQLAQASYAHLDLQKEQDWLPPYPHI